MIKDSLFVKVSITVIVQGLLFYLLGEFAISWIWVEIEILIGTAMFCLLISMSVYLFFAKKEKTKSSFCRYSLYCFIGFILIMILIFFNYMTLGLHILSFDKTFNGEGLLCMIVQIPYLVCLGLIHLISFISILSKNK